MAQLSGIWLGTYWQSQVPSRFEMSLIQGGNALRGNILDDNYLGEASLVGEVVGRKINFTKNYLCGSGHSVYYIGTVSEDGNFMQGQWQIDLFNSGTWEARRNDENLTLNLEVNKDKKVPISVE